MRIDLNNTIAQQLAAERSAQKDVKPDPSSSSVSEDKASFSQASLSLPALIHGASKPPVSRQERVAALREVVNKGEYKVDKEAVAEAMISEAAF